MKGKKKQPDSIWDEKAPNGKTARQNLFYVMKMFPFIGIGAAAYEYWKFIRYDNVVDENDIDTIPGSILIFLFVCLFVIGMIYFDARKTRRRRQERF